MLFPRIVLSLEPDKTKSTYTDFRKKTKKLMLKECSITLRYVNYLNVEEHIYIWTISHHIFTFICILFNVCNLLT